MSSSSCILREKENKNIYGWGYLIVILIMMVFELNRRVQRESVFVAVVMVYNTLWNVCKGSAIMPKILKQYHPFLYLLYMHEQ